MIIGIQAALYQDGPTANEFDGSATRLLYYKINSSDGTATYDKSYRYDTSQLTIDMYQKGGKSSTVQSSFSLHIKYLNLYISFSPSLFSEAHERTVWSTGIERNLYFEYRV